MNVSYLSYLEVKLSIEMNSNGIYMYHFKIQSLQIYNTTFSNFSYGSQKKQDAYIIKIVSMDIYPIMIWSSIFK